MNKVQGQINANLTIPNESNRYAVRLAWGLGFKQ